MRRSVFVLALCLACLGSGAVFAKKKAPASKGQAPSARAIGELAGKFKWGMTHEEVLKVLADQIAERYVEPVKRETDVYKQDQLRQQQRDEVKKIRESLVSFKGEKTGWDVSIIDKEFGQKNDESMIVMWEKEQRRFLFFWHGKLYKQYIAFNAEHPAFAGKSFDDFAGIIQKRYGAAEMKFASMRSKQDEMTLDHLEWPVSADNRLWAIDQSGFYGNYCLSLAQASVAAQVQKSREENSPKQVRGNALIDAVTSPESNTGDRNADVVDRIVGKPTR